MHGLFKLLSLTHADEALNRYVERVRQKGEQKKRGKIVTDMKHCNGEPLNMIGMNIPSIYGGMVGDQYWESQ